MSRASRYTIQGHEVTIPVEVRDASAHMASFLVPAAAAQDLIGYSGLEVARGFLGAFIHQLPVNQELTLEAGRGIWGFPKFLADIDLDRAGPDARCELRHEGEFVLSLSIRPGFTMPARGSSVDAYSHADGVLRRTAWSMEPAGVRGRPTGAFLSLGDHPIAKELRSLGLPGRAVFSSSIDHVRMQFQAPDEL